MIKRLSISLAVGAILLALTAPAAFAAGGRPDEIVVGDEFTLQEGETLNGNLLVIGGDVVLEEDSEVTGDMVVIGGAVEADGKIGGDVVVIGGDVSLEETAVVEGSLVRIGGDLERAPGAVVRGQETSSFGPGIRFGPWLTRPPYFRVGDLLDFGIGTVFRVVGWSLTMGVLALLILLFWPDQTARVSQAIMNAPLPTFGMGFLTAIVGAVLFSVLVLALCLGLIGWIGLVAAALFGWVALGSLVGSRLTPVLRINNLHPAVVGAWGTFMLTLGVEAIKIIPCLGDAIALVLASFGLGAVVLTRFGTRAYLPTMPMPPTTTPNAPTA